MNIRKVRHLNRESPLIDESSIKKQEIMLKIHIFM